MLHTELMLTTAIFESDKRLASVTKEQHVGRSAVSDHNAAAEGESFARWQAKKPHTLCMLGERHELS